MIVMQKKLRELEDSKDYASPLYKQIEEALGSHFTCRVHPRPDVYLQAAEGFNKQIYTKMQGNSEFTIGCLFY
jgi:hypothetical protein